MAQWDGSGVSPKNMLTSQTLVAIFEGHLLVSSCVLSSIALCSFLGMLPQPLWRSFLPIGGVSGSLKNRFVGTPAQGIVHAKNGGITGVSTLAGMLNLSDAIAIVCLMNVCSCV